MADKGHPLEFLVLMPEGRIKCQEKGGGQYKEILASELSKSVDSYPTIKMQEPCPNERCPMPGRDLVAFESVRKWHLGRAEILTVVNEMNQFLP